ncbi:MAG TPA: hypothetical protein DEO86_02135 [Colwellia sp.]|nr:hypothetical protein [Colwellia sp.]|tara:strand:- start:391 stop:609 length:219 start_codon:yes stop_codon:yes gene_type:complete
MTIKENQLINEVYNKARDLIEKEKINPIDFSGALLNVAKLILIEEVGAKDAEILFDFANKSFIIETEQITYH